MNRAIKSVILSCFFVAFFVGNVVNNNAVEKPNIVFLLADDHRWDRFGFMGNDWLETPHLDRLAGDGLVFRNVYHATPICKPARASIFLSQYVNTHLCGFDRPGIWCVTKDEFSRSYTEVLRKSGYFTGFVGKFGFPVAKEKIMNVGYVNGVRNGQKQLWKDEKYMPKDQFDLWYGFAGQGSYKGNGKHGTEFRGDQALEFLEKAKKTGKPFCLSLSFKAPHNPYSPSKKWQEFYAKVDIPMPENAGQEYTDYLPDVVKSQYRGKKGHGNKYQVNMRGYHGLISGIDEVVGRIRAHLQKLGLDKNTIIIYTSDNGYFCQSKGFKGKDLLYRESVRAPLLIFDPRLPSRLRSQTIAGLVSTIDFGPTMLDMAGVDAPASMQGKSVLPLIRGDKDQIHDAVYSENNFANFKNMKDDFEPGTKRDQFISVRSRAIRDPEYKYIRYYDTENPVEELWAIERDPLETKNLAENPEYAAVLEKMRKRYETFVKVTGEARNALVQSGKPIDFRAGSKNKKVKGNKKKKKR